MLNARFWAGEPSRNLSAAGVLVRQWDGQSDFDGGRPWLPWYAVSDRTCRQAAATYSSLARCRCLRSPPTSWCAQHEQFWPSSVINRAVRHLYYEDRAGFVLLPDAVTVLCACQADCNSNSQARGLRGCNARRCCDYPEPRCRPHHVDHDCSYPPDDIYEALAAQLRRGVPSHNEFVLDNLATAQRLPDVILAIFYMSDASREAATTMHTRFLAAYGLEEEHCPLLRLDLKSEGDPFVSEGG